MEGNFQVLLWPVRSPCPPRAPLPPASLAQGRGICSSAALCPYPLCTHAWLSTDLTAPPSWTFLVTERREAKGLLADISVGEQIWGPTGSSPLPRVQLTWAAHHTLAQRCLKSHSPSVVELRLELRPPAPCSACSHWLSHVSRAFPSQGRAPGTLPWDPTGLCSTLVGGHAVGQEQLQA